MRNTKSTKPLTANQVKQMMNSMVEHKIFAGSTVAATSTSGSIIYCSGLAQDDTSSGRTGMQVKPDNLTFRFFVEDGTANTTRLIFVSDSVANAAAPTVDDILSSVDHNSTYDPLSLLNRRFKYLYDGNIFTSDTGEKDGLLKGTIPLKGIISYAGTGSTSASAGKNSLFALVICESGTPTYNLKTQFHYTDA